MAMTHQPKRTDEGEAFWQQFVFPEEERLEWTAARWDGSYRWFKTPNVICFEQYRAPNEWARIASILLRDR